MLKQREVDFYSGVWRIGDTFDGEREQSGLLHVVYSREACSCTFDYHDEPSISKSARYLFWPEQRKFISYSLDMKHHTILHTACTNEVDKALFLAGIAGVLSLFGYLVPGLFYGELSNNISRLFLTSCVISLTEYQDRKARNEALSILVNPNGWVTKYYWRSAGAIREFSSLNEQFGY